MTNGLTPAAYPTAPLTVGPDRDLYPPLLEIDGRLRLIEQHLGVLTTHQETFDRYSQLILPAASGLAAGFVLLDEVPFDDDLHAKSFIFDNPTGYTLGLPSLDRYVPPWTFGHVVVAFPATRKLKVIVSGGAQTVAGFVRVIATERLLPSTAVSQGAVSGGGASAVTIDPATTQEVNTGTFNLGGGPALAVAAEQYIFDFTTFSWALQQSARTAADANVGEYMAAYAQAVMIGSPAGVPTWDQLRTPKVFKPQNAVNTNAEITIWTPAAGRRFRLMGYQLAASVAGNVLLRDNTAGTIISVLPSAAGGAGVYVDLKNGILSAAANNVLTATGPAASTLSGVVFGTEE